ncbi:MAG: exo-alpha-sialidase [Candidatus Hydrogenedentes bacterium]|nr:exo-alpha-sialidase [Candidatus Hydrogenedentota bacterium]
MLPRLSGCHIFTALFFLAASPAFAADGYPHPKDNPESPLMLQGPWVPENTHDINFDTLPRIPSRQAIVSDARPHDGVNQHNYLTYYGGKYWAMWSDGPAVEDMAGQRVKFSTSPDALEWSAPEFMTPIPPNSAPDSPVYNTRSEEGFRWISRGFWQRDGELLALASLDESAGFFGPSLELHAFRYNKETGAWDGLGVAYKNAINNFAPKKIPSGEWMMSRRTFDRHVHFLVGGVQAFDQWESYPVVFYGDERLKAEEPYWWVLPDENIMALFRDNNRSGYLFRSFSTDNGRTWSPPAKTNFPDATSKFNGLQMSDGRYVLVSNANHQKRDPLVLSLSDDGMVFNKMGYLTGGRHVDYPHVIEHDGHLLVAFAGSRKQTCEVLKIRIADLSVLDTQE